MRQFVGRAPTLRSQCVYLDLASLAGQPKLTPPCHPQMRVHSVSFKPGVCLPEAGKGTHGVVGTELVEATVPGLAPTETNSFAKTVPVPGGKA